ncbi:MAG: hypothetical protein JW741_07500 [Sedimentisphaerales bacterium]|nr:hypothetical protein [Sedimentisphaerales bacterium]
MTTEIQTLHLDQIRIDGGTQPRVEINEDVVTEYAGLYASGVDLPPVVVFYDGTTYWLADGFHRYWANKRINCDYVFAKVHPGTKRDAQWYSFSANAAHGLRRTREDVARILRTLLEDEAWADKPDLEISKHTGIPRRTVQRHRESYLGQMAKIDSGEREVTRNGRTYKMDTGNIGKGSSQKKRKGRSSPQISRSAQKPTRTAPEFQPRVNIDIPHDANAAARALLSALGDDFARDLITELTTLLEQG